MTSDSIKFLCTRRRSHFRDLRFRVLIFLVPNFCLRSTSPLADCPGAGRNTFNRVGSTTGLIRHIEKVKKKINISKRKQVCLMVDLVELLTRE